MQLKDKYENVKQTKNDPDEWKEALGLQGLMKRNKELDKEYDEVGKKKDRTYDEIEKLVNEWKEQKRVLGVGDSDVESRVQIMFAMLDNDSMRRRQYISDMEMFKKRYNDTKAVTTSNIVRIKEIEDIIVQRDCKEFFNL